MDICKTTQVPRLLNHLLSHYCTVNVRNAAQSTVSGWWESVSGVSHGGNDGQQCRWKQQTLSGITLIPRRDPPLLPLLSRLYGLSCRKVLMYKLSESTSTSVMLPTFFLRNKRNPPRSAQDCNHHRPSDGKSEVKI